MMQPQLAQPWGGASHFSDIAGPLAERNRVIAIDLPGFGFSPAAGRRTSIEANTKVLDRFINETLGSPVILMGNSMGGAVTILQAAASPQAVAAVVLVDPALPRPAEVPDPQVAAQFLMYALPGVGEAFMDIGRRSRTDRELVERVINLCFVDPRRSSPELMDAATELVAYRRRHMPAQDAAFLQAARSIVRAGLRPRQLKNTMRSIVGPVLLIHGDRD